MLNRKIWVMITMSLGLTSILLMSQPLTLAIGISEEIVARATPPLTPPPNNPHPRKPLGDSACKQVDVLPTALIPVENPVYTADKQPVIWVHIPYGAADVEVLEFTLNQYDANNEETRRYRGRVTLPATPGAMGIRLPAGLVESGQGHRWYLELYCQGNRNPEPDQAVDAGLQRIAPNSPEAMQAKPPGYWYDRVTTLARQRLADPNNAQLQRQWAVLLTEIGQGEMADKPLLGEVELPARSTP